MYSTENTTEEGEICDTLSGLELQINLRTRKKHLLVLCGGVFFIYLLVVFCFHSPCLLFKNFSLF